MDLQSSVQMCQVGLLQQQLQLRKQRGELNKNSAGEMTDRESRLLMYQINSMMRPIQFDEEESNTLQDSQARFLLLAITNYRRLIFTCPLTYPYYPVLGGKRLHALWGCIEVNPQQFCLGSCPAYSIVTFVDVTCPIPSTSVLPLHTQITICLGQLLM